MARYEKINDLKAFLKDFRTLEEIAIHLGRGTRSVFRYIDFLKKENCGLRKGKNSSGLTAFKIQVDEQVSFNSNSVKILEKVKKNMPSTSSSDIKNRKLIDKLINAMQTTNPDDFKPEAFTTDRDIVMDYGPFSDNRIQDTIVNKVLDAIHNSVKIRITYEHSAQAGDIKSVEVSPVKIILRIDTVYVIAAEDDFFKTQTFSKFLLENIKNITVTNKPALNNLFFDSTQYYKYTYGKYTSNDAPQEVALIIKPEAKWLKTQFEKSHFSPAAEMRKEKGNDVVRLKLRLTPDFKMWLMGVLPYVQIQKPESLKKEMKDMLKATLAEMK